MTPKTPYELFEHDDAAPIKAWTRGVALEDEAKAQLRNVAKLPFIHKWVAAMPDVHWGLGATIGSVIPTHRAIIPAAVGVDIGCGMMASRTTLTANDLPDNLHPLRRAIERAVPVGMNSHQKTPAPSENAWKKMAPAFKRIMGKHPKIGQKSPEKQLGTLGGGNHFIEVCLDQEDRVWVMLHSGSRGIGNMIGRYFIALAKRDMATHIRNLPDKDLAYFEEGAQHFEDYVDAVGWAQRYARKNRDLMMRYVLESLARIRALPKFESHLEAVNCHHNYVQVEHHYGADVWVTRKGAVRAGRGEMGIIPGSMGARSYLVRGLGNPESFESCSHGAGRAMSRKAARRRFSVKDHERMTRGVECRKDAGVLDETPAAYKDIDAVMAAQTDLVEVVHTLKQVVCVKG
ncbi:MAG: RtcB family protein [Planctomycetota bacterium]|nr:RtcB family protein [Planctomycetota bacterium]